MPLKFIPKRSGPHRIACKALYRALLSQCLRLDLPSESFRSKTNPVKYYIRKQFRRNQHDQSATLIVTALKVGYEVEELLRTAADGDKAAFSKVLSLLSELQSQSDSDRERHALRPAPARKPDFVTPAPYPGAPKLLDVRPRPLSELSGRRHVPVLTAANSLPFLRIKKPQSPFLSRVLRDKLEQKQKWQAQLAKLDADAVLAAREDAWEWLVDEKQRSPFRPRFTDEMVTARVELEDKLLEMNTRAQEVAERMLDIVDEEKRLVVEERMKRRQEKSQKRRGSEESGSSSPVSTEPRGSGEGYVKFKPMWTGS